MSMGGMLSFVALGISIFGQQWSVPNRADWKVEGGVLHLLVGKEPPKDTPRRPMQFALADQGDYSRVRVEADMRPLGRSLIIVYAYRDDEHFDYAHLSRDTAAKQSKHNGIFHVYGGERVGISSEDGPAAFDGQGWHHVVLDWNGGTGAVEVQVDGKAVPALRAVDVSLRRGRVGIGSFDETGEFRNVKISGAQ